MQPKSLKLLENIREAAAFISETTQSLTLDRYRQDKLLRFAVERNFEIIGEAIKRLAAADQATASHIGDYQQIIAFRNVLIHGYDLVDHELVWSHCFTNLPQPKIAKLLILGSAMKRRLQGKYLTAALRCRL